MEEFANLILILGLIPALALFLIPNLDYVVKSMFVALVASLLGYLSIVLSSSNLAFFVLNSGQELNRFTFYANNGGIFGLLVPFVIGLIVLCVLLIRKFFDETL